MKKFVKICTAALLLAGFTVAGTAFSSCKSSKETTMYQTKRSKNKVVNTNYKMRGTTQRNKATYRSY
ncbi:MAG: hypothetical protein J6X62_07545 [Bacteroidales bacterium]|nr:hypothetical protein [Bacteroidales bacterium]